MGLAQPNGELRPSRMQIDADSKTPDPLESSRKTNLPILFKGRFLRFVQERVVDTPKILLRHGVTIGDPNVAMNSQGGRDARHQVDIAGSMFSR